MKLRRILKYSLAVSLVFGTTTALVGCNKDNSTVKNEDKKYEIYKMALDKGTTELSYEDWLISIKGEKGEKGDATEVTIGSNGNWFIDGVDTGVSSLGINGEDGVDGKDGTKWTVSDSIPLDSKGNNGDFHLNSETQIIYCKENGAWVEKVTIKDGKDGTNGKQIQLGVTESKITWKYVDSDNWNNLISLSELKGATGKDGKKVELRVENGNVEWRHENGTWDTLTSLESIKGDPGKDGTKWLSGNTHPDLVEGLTPNEGDFYFDTINDDIYRFVSDEWVLEVDLENKIQEHEFVLEDGIYTGFMHGLAFTVDVVKNGEKYIVNELLINGLPAEQMFVTNPRVEVANDIISVTVDMEDSDDHKVITTTTDMILREGNKLVLYVPKEEVGLIKGVYEDYFNSSSARVLTLSDSTFALTYDYMHAKGTWEPILARPEDGIYGISLHCGGRTMNVMINYFYRTMNLDSIGEFNDIVFDYNGEDFVYTESDDHTSGTIKIGDKDAVDVTLVEVFDKSTVGYIHLETEDNIYLIDYVAGRVYDVEVVSKPFAGSMYKSRLYTSLMSGQYNDVYYTYNNQNKLEMFGEYFYTEVDGLSIGVDFSQNDRIYIGYEDEEGYNMTLFDGYYSDLEVGENGELIANCNYMNVTLTITLNLDGTISTITVEENNGGGNVEQVKGVAVSSKEDILNAIKEGETKVYLTNSFDIGSKGENGTAAIVVTGQLFVDFNGYTITAINDDSGDGVFLVKQGGMLVVEDSCGGGGIDAASQYNDYSMAIWADGGNVTINGGTFSNVGAKKIDDMERVNNNEVIYVKNGGFVTINDGMFIGNNDKWVLNSHNEELGYFDVRGGVFANFDPSNAETDDNGTNPHNYVASGYEAVLEEVEGEQCYVVRLKSPAAVVATPVSDYETLKDIIENGTDDVILNDNIIIIDAINVNRTVTIYQNGYQLLGNNLLNVGQNGNLTLN